MGAGQLFDYFPELSARQREQFESMGELYEEWNSKVNLVSRKDLENLYERHILHSLVIAKVCSFAKGARVFDVGTGGGFPGIPLAVMFPDAQFMLCDSIGKKINVVRDISARLGLDNVETMHGRAETAQGIFNYVVSRAVTDMANFIPWVWNKIPKGQAGSLPNGILYLKGGDIDAEMKAAGKKYDQYDIKDMFEGEFFETKKVIYIPR